MRSHISGFSRLRRVDHTSSFGLDSNVLIFLNVEVSLTPLIFAAFHSSSSERYPSVKMNALFRLCEKKETKKARIKRIHRY